MDAAISISLKVLAFKEHNTDQIYVQTGKNAVVARQVVEDADYYQRL